MRSSNHRKRNPDRHVHFQESPIKNKVKKKNTLDSDEEDEEVEMSRMDEQQINELGHEPSPNASDIKKAGVRLSAFNMDEEMEEGYFDVNGFYQWKTKQGEEADAWLDNIEWDNLPQHQITQNGFETIDEDQSSVAVDKRDLIEKMMGMLKSEQETVAQCIRRLGGRKIGKKDRKDDPERDIETMEIVTSTADQLLNMGMYDVYEQTCVTLKNEIPIFWQYTFAECLEDAKVKFGQGCFEGPFDSDEMTKLKSKGQLKKCWCRQEDSERLQDVDEIREFK